jgi:hypothetical protein
MSMVSAMEAYANVFSMLSPINHFPAPRRIKSIVSIYNSSRDGTLKSYNHQFNIGEPRPSWTYRAARRNVVRRETLLTKVL